MSTSSLEEGECPRIPEDNDASTAQTIQQLTRCISFASCRKDPHHVCENLIQAIHCAREYVDATNQKPGVEMTAPILKGLECLRLLSKPVQGTNMDDSARRLVHLVDKEKNVVFSEADARRIAQLIYIEKNKGIQRNPTGGGRKRKRLPPPRQDDAPKSTRSQFAVFQALFPSVFSTGKLMLVLDLDHTLVNSTTFRETSSISRRLDESIAIEKSLPPDKRTLFKLDTIRMYTKLRPGLHSFLKQASVYYTLWIHTNGNKAYAEAILPLLDPERRYFRDRVIAQGAERPEDMMKDKPKYLTEGLEGLEPITVVVDDSHAVWRAHARNLIAVERYVFFPDNEYNSPCFFNSGRDESPSQGMLQVALGILKRVHSEFFDGLFSQSLDSYDVRETLDKQRQSVLQGVSIVFSRIIPLGQEERTHSLWKLATTFGAQCSTTIVPGTTTHVVARCGGTEKTAQAAALGCHIVSPDWLLSSVTLWARAPESAYRIQPS